MSDWAEYKENCARVRARLRAVGIEGEDIWEAADRAAEALEKALLCPKQPGTSIQ